MSRNRPTPTLADYLVIAVSPALIMLLIGSLVFFLLGIFYHGGYGERVHLVFALFIMAAVLIGRISIELGAEQAMMYAAPLALVTALALGRFLDLPLPLNLGLIALVWWSAHKLVIDCTLIDESQDYSGEGLLQVAGLTERAKPESPPDEGQPQPSTREGGSQPPRDSAAGPTQEPEGVTSRDAPPPWWRRCLHRPVRPHAPGVWIVYFSLAALPLFGFCQGFIPASDAAHRRYAFGCLVVYCASALGLLLTTSFLGLRRYLRQRRLQMPAAMAGMWVAVGCVLIVLLLAIAALLPRPNPEYAISEVPRRLFSPDQKASRHGVGDASAEKNTESAPAGSKEAPEREKDQPQEKPPPGDAQKGPKGSGGDKGARPSQRGDDKRSKAGDDRETHSGDGEPSKGKGDEPSQGKDQGQPKGGEDQGSKQSGSAAAAAKEERRDQSKSSGSGSPPSRPPQTPTAGSVPKYRLAARSMFDILKWAFYGLMVLAALYFAWRSREELAKMLRSLLEVWGNLWQWLFGGRVGPKEAAAEAAGQPAPVPVKRLADFVDPFAAGTADRLPPDELVRYSFEALEAWGRQSGCPRQPDQTAHEFAQQVGLLAEPLAHEARRLADLYSRVAYAPGSLSASRVKPLARLWQMLLATEPQTSPLENP